MKLHRKARPDTETVAPEDQYPMTRQPQPAARIASAANNSTGSAARERRAQQALADAAKLRDGLTPPQLATLATMEQFQWELRFVRRPMFLDPVPVLFSRDGGRIAVLGADGSIDENPGFKIRP